MTSGAAAPTPEVRRRALRVWILSRPDSPGFRSAVRLGLIAVYSIAMMWGGFFDWSGTTETVLWSVAAILWVTILVLFVREVRAADHPWRHLGTHLSLPLLLVAPAFLWLTWLPVAAFLLVVVAYVLELRHHSAGDGFLFSFGLVLFIGVFAGLSMVEIENDSPTSSLRSPSDAIFWSFASLLRINYGKALSPETTDGRVLATVVGVCAVLGASLFTAQVITWVVGSRSAEEAEREAEDSARQEEDRAARDEQAAAVLAELAEVRAELAALRAALADRPPPEDPAGTVAP